MDANHQYLMREMKKIKSAEHTWIVKMLGIYLLTGLTACSLHSGGLFAANPGEGDDNRKKIETLIHLSENAMDARLSVEYAEQAVRLADSLKLLPEKGKALHCSGRAWKNLGDRLKSEEKLNESRNIFLQIGSEKYVAIAERDLADNYRGA